jgi:NADH-quinone oxidoreductase subunit A
MLEDYLPVLFQIIIAVGFAVATLLVSVLLGRSARRTKIKDSAYECGMLPLQEGQPRFSVKFYIVAMLFVLFDIEVVFLYPWAVVYKDFLAAHGAGIFFAALSFVSILGVAFVYAWRKGVLDWKN